MEETENPHPQNFEGYHPVKEFRRYEEQIKRLRDVHEWMEELVLEERLSTEDVEALTFLVCLPDWCNKSPVTKMWESIKRSMDECTGEFGHEITQTARRKLAEDASSLEMHWKGVLESALPMLGLPIDSRLSALKLEPWNLSKLADEDMENILDQLSMRLYVIFQIARKPRELEKSRIARLEDECKRHIRQVEQTTGPVTRVLSKREEDTALGLTFQALKKGDQEHLYSYLSDEISRGGSNDIEDLKRKWKKGFVSVVGLVLVKEYLAQSAPGSVDAKESSLPRRHGHSAYGHHSNAREILSGIIGHRSSYYYGQTHGKVDPRLLRAANGW